MEAAVLSWLDQHGNPRRIRVIDRVFIGRSCKGVEPSKKVLIHDPLVSRDHAVVTISGKQVIVSDMSRNGTYLNGVRMAAGSSIQVKHNDVVRVGQTEIRIIFTSAVTLQGVTLEDAEATFIAPSKIYVTNLVADLRGFTGMAQKMDSQVFTHLLRHTFRSFGDIIQDNGGTLRDFAGDAISAFWEHPRGGLDAEKGVQACRAALKQEKKLAEIQAKISQNPELRKVKLKFGWGIATGQVTMSHYTDRSADLVLVGDATNMAFRLSCMAHKEVPATILFCSKTAELIREMIPVEFLGSFAIRGRKGVEKVYAPA